MHLSILREGVVHGSIKGKAITCTEYKEIRIANSGQRNHIK